MRTKILLQNLKRKISWETLSHGLESGTSMDFKGTSYEYNPVKGSEFLGSLKREKCLSS
jgi:hypothetical protein